MPARLLDLGDSFLAAAGEVSADDFESPGELLRHLASPGTGSGIVDRSAGWVASAPLRHLLRWEVPTCEQWETSSPVPIQSQPGTDWLVDRFLGTYLTQWRTGSLHLEYRWLDGAEVPPLADGDMGLRRVPPDQLNAEIARRAVMGTETDHGELVSQAVEFLNDGRPDLAVSLFEGAAAVLPRDQIVRNGLAFCQIPAAPGLSCTLFQELLDEGFDPVLVHANLLCAYRSRGDAIAARRHGRRALSLLGQNPPRSAYLWCLEPGPEMRLGFVDIEDYVIANLAAINQG